MRRSVFALAATTVLAVLAGCGGSPAGGSAGGAPGALRVVATTTQVADFVRNIGGDRVRLTQLIKPNVDPHDYEVSPADIKAIAEADVLVKNGVGLERFLDDAISAAGFTRTTVDCSTGVALRTGSGKDEQGGDPHIWHNPRNAEIMVRNIAAALSTADPEDRPTFEANAAAYDVQLDALDRTITQEIGTIPVDARKLVTNHDAFGYYVDHYHLRFVGAVIPSFDTSAELSGKDISDLVAKIRATGTKAVFSESSLPPKTAQTIGREAGVLVVAGKDALYGDSLGPSGSDGATYLTMMNHNTREIVTALGGTA